MQAAENPDDQKQCWVCFATAEDDMTALWVKPCKCRGTTKWVHQSCLQRWVDEKQKGNTFAKVTCSQCGSEYIILYPPLGILTVALENVDRVVARLCPVVTGGVLLSAVYWSAVTYGALTVFIVFGHSNGYLMMKQTDPVVLLFALPFIPVGLICGQMWRWEDEVVRIIARLTLNSSGSDGQAQHVIVRDQTASATRILCTALALPVISKIVGNFFFPDYVTSPLHHTLLGGAAFLAVKGVTNIYFKYQQLRRRKRRVILDYEQNPAVQENNVNNADLIQP